MNIRQGDILYVPIEEIPQAYIDNDGIVSEGEIAGHMHTLEGCQQKYTDIDNEYLQYTEVFDNGCKLDHPDHGVSSIPKGKYRIISQREYRYQGEVGHHD